MTDYQRNLLDTNLNKFKDFIEFVKFTYAHDIEFEMDEWEEYRDKFFDIKKNGTEDKIEVNTDNLILPNFFS